MRLPVPLRGRRVGGRSRELRVPERVEEPDHGLIVAGLLSWVFGPRLGIGQGSRVPGMVCEAWRVVGEAEFGRALRLVASRRGAVSAELLADPDDDAYSGTATELATAVVKAVRSFPKPLLAVSQLPLSAAVHAALGLYRPLLGSPGDGVLVPGLRMLRLARPRGGLAVVVDGRPVPGDAREAREAAERAEFEVAVVIVGARLATLMYAANLETVFDRVTWSPPSPARHLKIELPEGGERAEEEA